MTWPSEITQTFFENEDVNKILTIEASGIGMAVLTGLVFDCPVVFAKRARR